MLHTRNVYGNGDWYASPCDILNHTGKIMRRYSPSLLVCSTMNDYDKLEYIHSAIQEGDEDMLKQALGFVEDIREKHPQAPWNKQIERTE